MKKKRSRAQLIVERAAYLRRPFDQLISKLVADYGITDRAGLEETINDAGTAYDGRKYWASEEKRWPKPSLTLTGSGQINALSGMLD